MIAPNFSRVVRAHTWLVIILAAFLALAIAYSVVTPIFEAGDEIWHYPYVQHLATGHALPIQDPGVKTLWAQEGGQPPLYYALAALVTSWVDTRDLPDRLWLNPHAAIGIPLLFGNKNMIVHTRAENFLWQNTALAVHLIRFLSIIFSAVTVALTYYLALVIASPKGAKQSPSRNTEIATDKDRSRHDDERKALAALAAAFVAFNPMFLFISASVNNDSLAAMLAALTLFLLTRLFTYARTTRSFVILGIVLGLAEITKASDLGLIIVAGLVFVYLIWKETREKNFHPRSLAPLFLRIFLCAIIVVAIAGWWYARNWILYGDPFAFNVWVAIAGGRPTPVTLTSLLSEFQGLRISFWGNFGGVNIIAPEFVYQVLDALMLIVGIGLFLGLVRSGLPRFIALPAFWFALIFIALIRWTMLTMASQGRLLFPAISAAAVLFAVGLEQVTNSQLPYTKRVVGKWLFVIPVAFLFIFSALTPFLLIAPTYALPKRLAADASVPNPLHIIFEDQVELVGYNLPQRSITNYELPITLYWRARQTVPEDYSVYIHLFDASGNKIGQWDAYTGNGLYPTRLLQPNEILVDNYRVPVTGHARGPSVGRVEVGLYLRATLKNLAARDPQGRTITPSIARFKIPGSAPVRVENAMRAVFADRLALVGYGRDAQVSAGAPLTLRLYWHALAAMNEDYTIFVHLLDTNGNLIAQSDTQPQNGAYPTSFWDAGELVADGYAVPVPRDAAPGAYRVRVGVYRASDGLRLRAENSDEMDLGIVQIVR